MHNTSNSSSSLNCKVSKENKQTKKIQLYWDYVLVQAVPETFKQQGCWTIKQ